MKADAQTAAQPTRTKNRLTRISKPTPIRTLLKNSTRNTTPAAAVMPRWTMLPMAATTMKMRRCLELRMSDLRRRARWENRMIIPCVSVLCILRLIDHVHNVRYHGWLAGIAGYWIFFLWLVYGCMYSVLLSHSATCPCKWYVREYANPCNRHTRKIPNPARAEFSSRVTACDSTDTLPSVCQLRTLTYAEHKSKQVDR